MTRPTLTLTHWMTVFHNLNHYHYCCCCMIKFFCLVSAPQVWSRMAAFSASWSAAGGWCADIFFPAFLCGAKFKNLRAVRWRANQIHSPRWTYKHTSYLFQAKSLTTDERREIPHINCILSDRPSFPLSSPSTAPNLQQINSPR